MKLAICGGEKVRKNTFVQWPSYTSDDINEIVKLLKNTMLFRGIDFPEYWYSALSNDSSFIEKFEMEFSKIHCCKYGFCVNSGTTALELSLKALNLTEEDEVLVTPYTYFASASAVKKNGAKPIFVDIDRKTLNMDPEKAKKKITGKTKAIVIVHFGGIPADMEHYMMMAEQHNLKIIEDCCHNAFAAINDVAVGSYGNISCFSFQSSKLISCGEGGAILTNNLDYAEFMFSNHNGGRNRILRNEKESFGYLGGNYRLSSVNIAMLSISLKKAYSQFKVREYNVQYFTSRLKDIYGLTLIEKNNDELQRDNYIVSLRYEKEEFKGLSLKRFIIALNTEGIPCSTGYRRALYENDVLLNNALEKIQYREQCVETEKALKEIIWFSHFLFLGNKKDIDDIINAIIKVKENIHELIRS